MLIQCPRCSTGWRVADSPSTDNPIFKCGRCHHLFRRFPGAPEDGERRSVSSRRRTRPPASDNLEFIFPDETPGDVVETSEETEALAIEEDDASTPEYDASASPPDDHVDDTTRHEPEVDASEEMTDDDDLGGTEHTTGERTIAMTTADAERDDDRDAPDIDLPDDDAAATSDAWAHELEALETPEPEHVSRVLHVENVMPRSYGFTTIARSLLAIVALHALLALSIRVAPSYASAALSHLPLAGVLLAREPALTRSVELRNVAGTFQQLRNARRVFVITGEAVNHSPASIERIEVEATLYDGNGRVDQKVVSAGNRTTLRDLSEKEIALLQRLDPRRVVAPGESSTFLIVFLEPPQTVREFSSRVLTVRPSRRLAHVTPESPTASRPDSAG